MNDSEYGSIGRTGKTTADHLARERKILLYFSSIAHAYTHIVILAIVPLYPLIQKADGGFDLSLTETLLFAAIPLFFFGLGALPAGVLADRFGPLKIILLGLCVTISAILMLITAANTYQFGTALVLLGLGSSFYHPSGLSLVSQVFTTGRGVPMGIHGFLGNVGELCTPIISGLIGAAYGWRAPYMLWLVVGIVIMVVNIVLLLRGIQNLFISRSIRDHRRSSITISFRKAMTTLLILAILYGVLFELAYRGSIHIIPYAEQAFYHLSAEEAAAIGGSVVSVLMLFGAFAQLIGGKLADRFGNRLPLLTLGGSGACAILLMSSRAFAFEINLNGSSFEFDSLLLGAALFGFALFGTQPILNKLFAENTPQNIRGLFYGLMFFLKVGLASLALVILAFIAAETINSGFVLLLIFTLGTILIAAFIDRD